MGISPHFDALPKLTDDEAISLISAITRAHRFTGTVFTPTDVRDNLTEWFAADEVERDVTEVDVNAVLDSWWWRKGIPDVLVAEGGEMLLNAYNDTFDKNGNLRSNAEYDNEVAAEAAAQEG